MGRQSVLFFIFITILAALTGCGGHSKSSVGPIVSITLAPSIVSLNPGEVQQLSVSAVDANKANVFNQTFTFNSTNPNMQVSTSGLLCAGKWDSLTAPINCAPVNPGTAGLTSTITATAQSVTSNSIQAFVHEQVAKVVIDQGPPPSGTPTCSVTVNGTTVTGVPQNIQSALAAHAFDSGGQEITSSVGAFFWNLTQPSVATLGNFQSAGTNNITSKLPGATQVFANVGTQTSVNSLPLTFAECPVASMTISPNPVTALTSGGKTQQMNANVVDSAGKPVSGMKANWISSQPGVASINAGAGLATAVAGGTTEIILACTPDICNTGLNLPVYSNVAIATVPGTPTTTAYVSCSANCNTTASLVAIDTSKNTAGTTVSLPHIPNSMMFSSDGTKLFMGSIAGLMLFDPGSNSVANTVSNVLGTVLAVSPDGNLVVTSNPNDPGGPTITLFDQKGNSVTTFPGSATGAAFTPDSLRAYVAAGNNILVLQPGKAMQTIPVGAAITNISVLPDGAAAFAAAANTPFVNTCSETLNAGPGGSPLLVQSLPNAAELVGVDASGLLLYPASGACPATVGAPTTAALGAAFTKPHQIIVTPDSNQIYVTSDATGVLLHYDVATKTATPVPLSTNTATTTTGGSTPGSDLIYVGATDGKIHVINTAKNTDDAQVSVSESPDLVAVRP